MPIYEYVCKECGLEAERMVSFSKSDEQDCEKCKGRLHRKVSIPGYVWSPSKTRK
jgi:putative FmdB family regulatory protein